MTTEQIKTTNELTNAFDEAYIGRVERATLLNDYQQAHCSVEEYVKRIGKENLRTYVECLTIGICRWYLRETANINA